MSEDRTQPASKRRRLLAREQGQEAHSPELTASAGWLAVVLALGIWGDAILAGMIELIRHSFMGKLSLGIDPTHAVAYVRGQLLSVAWPFLAVLASFPLAATAAHQMQVRGLWAPQLLAPDPTRLWTVGRGNGLAAGLERTVWSVIKALVLTAVGAWALHAEWGEITRMGGLDATGLAIESGRAILFPGRMIALVLCVIGLVDYGLRFVRYETMLRTTPDEQREDTKAMEGDLGMRSRRRRIARSWRGDAPELLAGATLVVTGRDGLTLILGGGPPPRSVTLRSAARGNTGLQLRRTAESLKLNTLQKPELALRLLRNVESTASLPIPLPDRFMSELQAVWPSQ